MILRIRFVLVWFGLLSFDLIMRVCDDMRWPTAIPVHITNCLPLLNYWLDFGHFCADSLFLPIISNLIRDPKPLKVNLCTVYQSMDVNSLPNFPLVFINRSSSLPTIIEILMFWQTQWNGIEQPMSEATTKNEWRRRRKTTNHSYRLNMRLKQIKPNCESNLFGEIQLNRCFEVEWLFPPSISLALAPSSLSCEFRSISYVMDERDAKWGRTGKKADDFFGLENVKQQQ